VKLPLIIDEVACCIYGFAPDGLGSAHRQGDPARGASQLGFQALLGFGNDAVAHARDGIARRQTVSGVDAPQEALEALVVQERGIVSA